MTSKDQEPPQNQILPLINLFTRGFFHDVLSKTDEMRKIFPNSVLLYNISGSAHTALRQFDLAIDNYKKALVIKPDYSDAFCNIGIVQKKIGDLDESIISYKKAINFNPLHAVAYYNLGDALKEQCKLEEAIEVYNKVLSIKPDYVDAYYNLGNALKDQGKLEEAVGVYKKALAIKSDYAEVYNNLGVVLIDQGKLKEAIEVYNKVLSHQPNDEQAIENSQGLAVQLLPSISKYGYDFYKIDTKISSEIVLRPKYQIINAIKAFLETDFSKARAHNNKFKACDEKLIIKLKPDDKVFCDGYSNFLGKLLENTGEIVPVTQTENKVYHLGESHCLSYAHQYIKIEGSNFRVVPRIIFGAKAFHFSRIQEDRYKAITKANFVSLPKSSKVLISFGEIDCRPNEGFITSARKLDKPLEDLIANTVKGYVQWFLEQNAGQSHRLYFINVPAPFYDKEHSADLNSEVVKIVGLFNAAIKKYLLHHSIDLIDVFQFTVGKDGFSNGLFHVDSSHLGAKAIPEIEQQLT